MCYDHSYLTKKNKRYKEYMGLTKNEMEHIRQHIAPTYHVNAYAHPDIPALTSAGLTSLSWGLIPFWVKDSKTAVGISKKTINCRGEEMFDKPAFREAAKKRRCLLLSDGFFEHHWYNEKSYPFYIQRKDEAPFFIAGLHETCNFNGMQRQTVSMVTCAANSLMAYIHNKPSASETHRMPLIIEYALKDRWLHTEVHSNADKSEILEMIKPYDTSLLKAYTVNRLRGKEYMGNKAKILLPKLYINLTDMPSDI